MKTIKLLSLKLENFQGGMFTLNADGEDTNIFGDNGTGKTRLASAFSWLLFDKDSLSRADFEIKNLDAQGEAEHGIEHSVEGFLDIDGQVITLKKVYKEIWQKKRGSAQATFTGHTTDYSIGGVPVQKKEYVARVAEIAGDESIFRLLTSPAIFPALPWQRQRNLLLEICGDMKDEDVIASDSKLANLSEILGKRSIDDHRKIISAKKSEINKELEKIPIRINEVHLGMPEILTTKNQNEITNDIIGIELLLSDAKLKLRGVETGGKLAGLTQQIAVIDSELQKRESVHYTEMVKIINDLSQQIAEKELKVRMGRIRTSALENEIEHKKKQIDRLEQELTLMRIKWAEIDAQTFQYSISETCPTCNQPLPIECVREAREKAHGAFNLQKAENLAGVERKGKELAEDKNRLLGEIESAQNEIILISDTFTGLESEINKLKIEHAAAKDYPPSTSIMELLIQKSELAIQVKAEKDGYIQDSAAIKIEIQSLEAQLKDAKEQADRFIRREAGEKRIGGLKIEEKKLAAEYERLESELYLTEQFIRTKVKLLTDRINSKFEITRFKLFNILVNGGIEECCEITVGGIPYNGGLNSGARTNAGLDVIRTLQKYYGIQPVVFVDNAESVVALLSMECQVVRLIVSEKDKILRVETAEKARENDKR